MSAYTHPVPRHPGGPPAPGLVRPRLRHRVLGPVPRGLGARPPARRLLSRLLRGHDRARRHLRAGRAGRCGRDLPPALALEPRLRRRPRRLPRLQRLQHRRATARPHGAYFVFELLWRGVGYGVIDTLLLTIFPCFVAYKLLHGHVAGLKGKLRFTALMLPLVLIVTATYHLGLSPVPPGRAQPTRDRQRADLDPDLRDREPGRLDRRARLPTRRRRHARLRVARSSTRR